MRQLYIIMCILHKTDKNQRKTSWLKIPKFSATAFLGGLFHTIYIDIWSTLCVSQFFYFLFKSVFFLLLSLFSRESLARDLRLKPFSWFAVHSFPLPSRPLLSALDSGCG